MADSALSAAARRLAKEWRDEVVVRQRRSKHDPVAEALDTCAAELLEQVQALGGPSATLTVEQYAADHAVTPQTVRNWLRRGELAGERTPAGWEIPRGAERRALAS